MSVVMVSWTLLLGNTFSLLVTISLLSEAEVAKVFFFNYYYRGVGIPRTGILRTPLEFTGQAFAF